MFVCFYSAECEWIILEERKGSCITVADIWKTLVDICVLFMEPIGILALRGCQ